jgi:hypothetical protein
MMLWHPATGFGFDQRWFGRWRADLSGIVQALWFLSNYFFPFGEEKLVAPLIACDWGGGDI